MYPGHRVRHRWHRRPVLDPESGRIIVTSRTYNLLGEGNPLGLPAGATFGQYIPAIPRAGAHPRRRAGTADPALPQPATDGGAAPTSVWSTSPEPRCGSKLNSCRRRRPARGVNRTLLPYEYEQINRVFERVTTTMWMTVTLCSAPPLPEVRSSPTPRWWTTSPATRWPSRRARFPGSPGGSWRFDVRGGERARGRCCRHKLAN